jgi:3-deoxy-manno-octulosonate cytidylyltransferase (CMP-KDO synthetase)
MKSGEHIVAVIPARYGSTRLPGKPLIDLCGKPMIQRVYERTYQARLVDRVIVATDDERIAAVVRQFGGEAVMTPSDLRSGSDRSAFAVRRIPEASIVVNVQGDEPLIEPKMIDEAVQPLLDDAGILAGTLVRHTESAEELLNPNIVKAVLDAEGFALYFSRSPIPHNRDGRHSYPFFKHIGLYVFRREFLLQFCEWPETPLERMEKLEQLRILEHGCKIKATVTEYDSVPVDTPEDVEKVCRLLKQQVSAESKP